MHISTFGDVLSKYCSRALNSIGTEESQMSTRRFIYLTGEREDYCTEYTVASVQCAILERARAGCKTKR